jgi:hypothetical protein
MLSLEKIFVQEVGCSAGWELTTDEGTLLLVDANRGGFSELGAGNEAEIRFQHLCCRGSLILLERNLLNKGMMTEMPFSIA